MMMIRRIKKAHVLAALVLLASMLTARAAALPYHEPPQSARPFWEATVLEGTPAGPVLSGDSPVHVWHTAAPAEPISLDPFVARMTNNNNNNNNNSDTETVVYHFAGGEQPSQEEVVMDNGEPIIPDFIRYPNGAFEGFTPLELGTLPDTARFASLSSTTPQPQQLLDADVLMWTHNNEEDMPPSTTAVVVSSSGDL